MNISNNFKNLKYLKYIIVGISLVIIIIVYARITKTDKNNYSSGKNIIGKKIPIQDSLGFPYGILFLDDKIILLDRIPVTGNNQVSIYDLNNYNRISSFGRSGSGPGEFQSVKSISSIFRNNKSQRLITIWDSGLLRLSIFDIFNPVAPELKNIFYIKKGMPYSPVFIDDTTIACLGLGFLDGRFAVLDTAGNIKQYLGIPLPGRKTSTPMPVHQQAMQGKLRITPDGSRLILTANLSDLIDIYDSKGELIKRIIGPLNVVPKYTIGKVGNNEPVMVIDPKNAIMGYGDVALTNDKIFALFVGLPFEGNQLEGKEIHVFNMQGELLDVFILDRKLFSITYDEKNKRLYGIQLSPFPEIYCYQL